ncbi:MAG: hypothetical protein R2747_00950 [Pyrinomonadaceae bacterium]
MWQKSFLKILFVGLMLTLAFSVSAQRKKNTKPAESQKTAEATPTPPLEEDEDGKTPAKKNSRPGEDGSTASEPAKKNPVRSGNSASQKKDGSVYFYEFSRPEFNVSDVYIEHDENGKGTIRFLKKYFDEEIVDPIQLSEATLEKVKTLWENLNFLDSDENYQFEKDYSHLGNIKITMKKDGRERTAKFNWTTNPDAKALADEYRRIGNQHIWMFDINVSRENQPLESARIMDALDLQLRRNEIADPVQMIPFLKELGNDERIPLISRNHATRLVQQIEKQMAKKKDDQ